MVITLEGKENTDFWDGEKGEIEGLSLEIIAQRDKNLILVHYVTLVR